MMAELLRKYPADVLARYFDIECRLTGRRKGNEE